ncbi:MAG: DUF1015 domain-containing protein [Termitinemataceae bacterium]|nr:MAG: DUF1015 domain-containing protein [Termitinemataceae bacterium]
MEQINEMLSQFGVKIPDVILPSKNVDLQKWAVVACDQWTQSTEYWEEVKKFVGSDPSTLNLIYPEVYLKNEDRAAQIKKIHKTMGDYLEDSKNGNILTTPRDGAVFLERQTTSGVRRGLLMAIDLEKYDYKKSDTIIRATEETISDRLPPRMEIRRGAALELPHIMLLIDDVEDILMPLLAKLLRHAPIAYETPLMMESGSVQGRLLYRKNDWNFIGNTLELLLRTSCTKYHTKTGFLFAVGDGNHSLAAAKAVWEEYKEQHAGEQGLMQHNARYAMAEIVNIYDDALLFEPIHRVLFNTNVDTVKKALNILPGVKFTDCKSFSGLSTLIGDEYSGKNRIGIAGADRFIMAEFDPKPIAVVQLDKLMPSLCLNNSKNVDYIHGDKEVERICTKTDSNAVGCLMPPFAKNTLFESVNESGMLPRKTFSMGDASDKRFYLECRQIF